MQARNEDFRNVCGCLVAAPSANTQWPAPAALRAAFVPTGHERVRLRSAEVFERR